MPHSSNFPVEFQAVVLAAGEGSRFRELTKSKDKALLPVGNRPLIWYPLKLLSRMGFTEVIVICLSSSKQEIRELPNKHGLENLKLDLHVLEDEGLGTAEALNQVHDKLTAIRIMVISGDLWTDLPMHNLTSLHRLENAAVTMLFHKGAQDKAIPVPGPKVKSKKERDFVGIDLSNQQLCYLSSEADLADSVSMKRRVLVEHPRIQLYTALTDAHFYIFEKWVLDYLKMNEEIVSLKGEFLPHLVKKQFSNRKKKSMLGDAMDEERDNSSPEEPVAGDVFSFIPSDKMSDLAKSLSISSVDPKPEDKRLLCFAYIQDSGTCFRINTLPAYCDSNRQALPGGKLALTAQPTPVHRTANVMPKAQTGNECLLGEDCTISGKTTLKHSIVGARSFVSEKVMISNSVLMEDVNVAEGCQISGSIICDGVQVPSGCVIKDCIITPSFECMPGGKYTAMR